MTEVWYFGRCRKALAYHFLATLCWFSMASTLTKLTSKQPVLIGLPIDTGLSRADMPLWPGRRFVSSLLLLSLVQVQCVLVTLVGDSWLVDRNLPSAIDTP